MSEPVVTIELASAHCYLCGREYLISAAATSEHTHHADGNTGEDPRARLGRVLYMLEACQRERDAALTKPVALPFPYNRSSNSD